METLAFADLYLPAAMRGEKTGCITNADRSVNLLLKAVERLPLENTRCRFS